ncbi:MAG TPA: TraB/GumN family protein [Rhizomicrobium sp.]|nr:TraB/GumN family protein [Rhizomicrobium sp.]
MKRFVAYLRRAAGAFAAALLLAGSSTGHAATMPAKPLQAHPALWTVHGSGATVYLLGSIHVLAPQMQWHTPEIDKALNAADVFVFEIPMDDSQKTAIQDFVRQNGLLPAGMALPSLLNEQARKDYRAALNLTHVPPETLTPLRPWLALLMLNAGVVTQQHLSPAAGLDRQVYAIALKKDAPARAFETPEQQLKMLMPEDQSLEVQEFDAGLKELLKERSAPQELIDAWARGDVKRLGRLMNSGFADNPKAEKILFEDRNRAWVTKLESMLNEKHVFFVTVGAGHLAGPKGVPAMLRREGYRVDGP